MDDFDRRAEAIGDIEFREEVPSAEAIHAFYEAMGWNDILGVSARELRRAMEGSFLLLSAYNRGRLIGTVRLVSDGVLQAYLCGLGVLPEYRGRGIGTLLLERITSEAGKRSLRVQFFCEEELEEFYEARGYRRFAVGMRPCGLR